MNTVISIIVPVYNAESFLKDCLDSIAAQTFDDFEVLLVDDGSTDSSGKICDDYQSANPKFHAIHQRNQGVSAARNTGLDMATGEYLYFIDSDDTIEPETLEHLYAAIKSGDYDIATSGCIRVFQHGDERVGVNDDDPSPIIFDGEEAVNNVLRPISINWTTCWNKLIPRGMFSGMRFNNISQEDLLISGRLYARSRKIIYLNEALYYYRDTDDSLSKCPSYISKHQTVRVFSMLLNDIPDDRTTIRAIVLSKLYKRIVSSIFFLEKEKEFQTPVIKEHKTLCKKIVKETRREFFSHPNIKTKDKLTFMLLWTCPALLGLAISFLTRSAK